MPPRGPMAGNKRKRGRPGADAEFGGGGGGGQGRRKGRGGLKDSFLIEAVSSDDELDEGKDDDGELQDLMVEGRGLLRRGGKGGRGGGTGDSDDEDQERETLQQKRVRLAKAYLKKMHLDKESLAEDAGEHESDEDQEDLVGDELQEQEERRRGVIHKTVAPRFRASSQAEPPVVADRLLRGHKRPVTCIAVAQQRPVAFSGSKDSTILQWDVETGKKLHLYPRGHKQNKVGHTDEVLSLAVSGDGNQLVSASRDRSIRVWDARTHQQVDVFTGHKDAVSCLALQVGDDSLYSGSLDRTVRVWSLRQMAYVETLFGHHGQVMSVDSLLQDRAVTCGADKTVRLWKVSEQKQLMYRGGHEASIDCVRMLSDRFYVTGSQDGGLALWSDSKRKPIARRANAHGGNWITSVAAVPYGDVIASGSSDGQVRIWDCLPGNNANKGARITALCQVAVPGFVNSLQFSQDSRLLFCGVGQEHRMGRWGKIQEARNGIHVLRVARDQ